MVKYNHTMVLTCIIWAVLQHWATKKAEKSGENQPIKGISWLGLYSCICRFSGLGRHQCRTTWPDLTRFSKDKRNEGSVRQFRSGQVGPHFIVSEHRLVDELRIMFLGQQPDLNTNSLNKKFGQFFFSRVLY